MAAACVLLGLCELHLTPDHLDSGSFPAAAMLAHLHQYIGQACFFVRSLLAAGGASPVVSSALRCG